jgi:hypothetical protein
MPCACFLRGYYDSNDNLFERPGGAAGGEHDHNDVQHDDG